MMLMAGEWQDHVFLAQHAGYPSILCYDGHSDGPAFVLANGPSGEWATRPDSGAGLIVNPRNPYGHRLDMTWMNSNLMETKL